MDIIEAKGQEVAEALAVLRDGSTVPWVQAPPTGFPLSRE